MPQNASLHFVAGSSAQHFSMVCGGEDVKDFIGACVVRTIQMNGHFNFHYDENLATIGPSRGYIPTTWTEL